MTENISCPRCRFRHPATRSCEEAKRLAADRAQARSAAELMREHVSAQVECRACEMEAFILASCRVENASPFSVRLVETRSPDGLRTTWHLETI